LPYAIAAEAFQQFFVDAAISSEGLMYCQRFCNTAIIRLCITPQQSQLQQKW
jgi:hypothetical protein